MKFADDVLLCIIEALRKGMSEGSDISDLLRQLELEPDGKGKLKLKVPLQDVWKEP